MANKDIGQVVVWADDICLQCRTVSGFRVPPSSSHTYPTISRLLDSQQEGLRTVQKAHVGGFVEERKICNEGIRKPHAPKLENRLSRSIRVSKVVGNYQAENGRQQQLSATWR